MPKISVCIPVYKVEKTLRRCVDSIFAQTFQDFEVILVDDGSPDNSGSICDQIAAEHNNVKVIHKSNEGLGPTRDRGLDAATGEYVYHCDSDDWFEPEMLESAVAAIEKHNADVVIFGYHLLTEEQDGTYKSYGYTLLPDGVFEGDDVRRFYVENYFNSFSVMSAWNRLCRRSFLIDNNIRFPKLRRAQDMAYSLILFDKINKLVTLKETYYDYVITPGVYKTKNVKETVDINFMIYNYTKEYFTKWNLYTDQLRNKIENITCVRIANSCSYFLTINHEKAKEESQILFNNQELRVLLKNSKFPSSRFMRLFKYAILLKSKKFLQIVCNIQRKHANI